jgi:hypothetical protein
LGRKTYIQAASDHAREQSLFTHLQTLLDGKQRDDALLERQSECCALGERKCQKTRPEWWTLEVNRLRIWRRILQKLKSSFKNKLDNTTQLQTSCDKVDIATPLPATVEDATLALTKCRKDIRACLKKSKETRALKQLERISMERYEDQQDKAKIINAMHNSELHAQMYSMFRNM